MNVSVDGFCIKSEEGVDLRQDPQLVRGHVAVSASHRNQEAADSFPDILRQLFNAALDAVKVWRIRNEPPEVGSEPDPI